MKVLDRLERDMVEAAKARQTARLGAIRFARSELKNREIELGRALEDDDVVDVLSRIAKRHRESIEQFDGAGRTDLVERESAQLEVIEQYLPEKLSGDDLDAVVDEAIAEANATSVKDLGVVMKVVMPKVRGRAEGAAVKDVVQARLEAKGQASS